VDDSIALDDFAGIGSLATPGTFLSATNMSKRLLDSSKIALVTPKLRTALNTAITSGDTAGKGKFPALIDRSISIKNCPLCEAKLDRVDC
jgi:hypothetical protein